MHLRNCHHCGQFPSPAPASTAIAILLAFSLAAYAQQPPSTQAPAAASRSTVPGAARPRRASATPVKPISEDELRRQFAGKTFYLRGGYLDNDLQFDEEGRLASTSPKVSYTLSMIGIDKVRLSKHKLEFVGIRYGLHFLGAGPTEDPLQASDKVRITPKKKSVKITIGRAEVVTSKKKSADDDGSQLTQARANQLLKQALDRVFSQGLDDSMIASLPEFWRLYYQSASGGGGYKPSDPSVLRQNTVDQKARLLTNFEPPSNDFAQAAGVAGVALYHVVIGRDGKPMEIAVGRPIGFGLDENAVDSIRKASFQPALKDGKPVPVLLDLLVQFRIYSGRTAPSVTAEEDTVQGQPSAPSLPGPYTANEPAAKPPQ